MRILQFLRRRTRMERLFLICCFFEVIYWSAQRFANLTLPGQGVLHFVFSVFATLLGIIYLRRLIRRILWRLRNRLIITYIFIGFVPIALVLLMLAIGIYILVGQVTTYLVTTELERRNELIRDAAYALGWNVAKRMGTEPAEGAANEFVNELHVRLPRLSVVIGAEGRIFLVPRDADVQEFPVWSHPGFTGLLNSGSEYALAAHVEVGKSAQQVQVFAYEPADPTLLDDLLPGLASIRFIELETAPSTEDGRAGQVSQSHQVVRFDQRYPGTSSASQFASLPAPGRFWDINVTWITPVSVWRWGTEKGKEEKAVIAVVSRPSLIFSRLFSTLGDLAPVIRWALRVIAGLFLLAAIASIFFGVGLTRSITRSVEDLYEATRRIKVGDFTHRIPIRTADQLSELANSFNSMTENIQKLIVESQEKERLKSELDIAREVQQQLFPKRVPRLHSLELAGHCDPARVVSGDYYDFVPVTSNWTALAIGDIAGKGISAALLMASIQSSLRAQLTTNDGSEVGERPVGAPISTSTLVTRLNRQLYESTSPEKFASFYCGVYDDHSSRLFYTNAGHLPPILIRKGRVHRLEVSGMVLGVLPDNHYDQNCLELEAGDLLMAYTDGITEPENVYGEEFGEKRLADLLLTCSHRPLEEVVLAVITAVREWNNNPELQDDMTILLARRI